MHRPQGRPVIAASHLIFRVWQGAHALRRVVAGAETIGLKPENDRRGQRSAEGELEKRRFQ